jgi:hypothetical protein
MWASPGTNCGDTGAPTVNSTNVHFHGLNAKGVIRFLTITGKIEGELTRE